MASVTDVLKPYLEAFRKGLKGGSRIGLDITSDTIVVVELKKKRGVLTLANVAIASTPLNAVQDGEIVDPTAVAEVISELLTENDIKAKGAICAVAGQSTIVRPVRFPMMPESELMEVINYEAERYIPFAIEDVNISHQIANEVEEDGTVKLEVILVAAQKNLVQSIVKTMNLTGLSLDVVDVASFAVLRALADTEQLVEGQSVALVHIQGWTTDINVLVSGVPRFSRSIPIGYSFFIESVLNALALDEDTTRRLIDAIDLDPQVGAEEDAQVEQAAEIIRPALMELTGEIGRSLDFYLSHGTDPIDRVILSGRGGNMRNLDSFLTSRLGLAVEVARPFSKIEVDEEQFDPELLYPQASTLAAAIGLAIRGAQGL